MEIQELQKKSENIQKLYDEIVQGRQYRTSKEMENMKGVDDKDLDWRFKQASEAKSDYVHKKRKIKLVKSFLLKPKIYTFMIKLLLFKMPKC